jgi:chromosome segregation ATPase
MIAELDKLEERIDEAAEAIRALKEQNRELAARLAVLERERGQHLEERSALAERIARLVDRVDALRTEL